MRARAATPSEARCAAAAAHDELAQPPASCHCSRRRWCGGNSRGGGIVSCWEEGGPASLQ